MKGLSFYEKINFELSSELRELAEANESVDEVLTEVDRVIEARFFNTNKVILGQAEMVRWLWWEKTRRSFQFIALQIAPAPF